MKRDTLYTILTILIIVFFTINFIFYKMTNRVLMSGITLGIITGSVLLLKDNYQSKKKKEKKIN